MTESASSLADLLTAHPFSDGEEPDQHRRSECHGRHRARRKPLASALNCVPPGSSLARRSSSSCPMGQSFVFAMFGVWLAGAVFVPANARQPQAELDHVLSSTAPACVINSAGIEVSTAAPTFYELDTAFVTWTSGTTGQPKPILQTHSGYLELLDRVLGPLRGRPADPSRPPSPNLVPVSLALNAGIYNVLFGLRAGASLVLMDRFSTAEFAALVSRFSIRSTVLPPAAMVMLADDASVTDLTPLRYVRSITAPLSPLAARRFTEKFGVTVLNGYGQAEVGEVIGWTAGDARDHPEKVGAVGRPHPGVAIKVVAEDGSEAPVDTVGELLVKPPRMASGYAGGDTLDDRLDPEGYVRTGDFARVDGDAFVWIEGRIGDVINRGGNKVFPGKSKKSCFSHPV